MAYASAHYDVSYRSFRRREFRHIEEHLPAANQRGRPRMHAPREILNASFSMCVEDVC